MALNPRATLEQTRCDRLEEAYRRARFAFNHPLTPFETELSQDVLYLLREVKRLEKLLPATLPFENGEQQQ